MNLINFDLEFLKNYDFIIGVDEVGRGCLAGCVVAGAISFEPSKLKQKWLIEINDSKKLNFSKRQSLSDKLKENCFYALGEASVAEIDKNGILNATFLAMRKAINQLLSKINPTKSDKYLILVDGNLKIRQLKLAQKTVIKGDSQSLHIASASILAKVYRDNLMIDLSGQEDLKHFNWQKNKGYGTKDHQEAIINYGASVLHRQKFIRKLTPDSLDHEIKLFEL